MKSKKGFQDFQLFILMLPVLILALRFTLLQYHQIVIPHRLDNFKASPLISTVCRNGYGK